MIKRSIYTGAVAMILCLSLCAAASAASPPPLIGENTAGVSRAEAAGISVDPIAAQIMAEAPVGTCLNDPTQPKCASIRPTEIIGSTGPGYGPIVAASSATVSSGLAGPGSVSPDASGYQCYVYADDLDSNGAIATADGSNFCYPGVDSQQMFTTLESYWTSDDQWHIENTGAGPVGGAGWTYASTEFDCNYAATRAWENLSVGYEDTDGVWYAGQSTLFDNLLCVG